MKIAVNTRYLLEDRMEGIARFNYEILKRIVKDHPEDQFYFFFDRPYSQSFIFGDNVTPLILFPPTRHPLLIAYWLEFRIKRQLKKLKPDVFITGDTYMPVNIKVPSVIVSHDLSFIHYPEMLRTFDKLFYHKFFPIYHKQATKIVAVSEFTKKDIIDKYHVEKDKIDVVYNASNGLFYPISEIEKSKTKEKFTNGKPYFVYLGSIHPRKNIINLVKAFEIFKDKSGSEHKLALIGRPAWKNDEFFKTLNNSKYLKDIILKQIPRNELPAYIGSAEAMFYVSFFEGFGIPIVEGFEAGIPVVTSNTSSMPEVAGDACILVDPNSPEKIAEAMFKMSTDESLKAEMIKKGFRQLKKFSWDESALKMYKILETAVKK